jgi:hypothetical protein
MLGQGEAGGRHRRLHHGVRIWISGGDGKQASGSGIQYHEDATMNDEYHIESNGRTVGFIEFDEDSYAVHATTGAAEFAGLDFEWFRATCEHRGWTFNMLAF